MRSSKNEFYGILMPEDAAGAAGMMDPADYFNSIQPRKYRSSLERHKKVVSSGSSRIQQKTVGSHFKQQLHMAMSHIRASQPHYIRCLKPNDKNRSGIFDRNRILEQLCYSGVLEVVRVARAGYPTRFKLNEFAERFAVLGSSNTKGAVSAIHKLVRKGDSSSLRKACEKIASTGKLTMIEDYQIGHTKVFLRPSAFTRLEVQKEEKLRKYVVVIQRAFRSFLVTYKATRKLREAKRAAKSKQEAERKMKNAGKNAAILIQRMVRGMQARMNLSAIIKGRDDAAEKIKKAYRRKVMKDRLREIQEESVRQRSAVLLQGVARSLMAQKLANNLYAKQATEAAAINLQRLARMMAAKKTKRMLEDEAEEERRTSDGVPENPFVMYVVPLLALVFFSNPMLLIGILILGGAMALGAGLTVEAHARQRQNEEDMEFFEERRRTRTRKPITKSSRSLVKISSSKSTRSTSNNSPRNAMADFDDYDSFYSKANKKSSKRGLLFSSKKSKSKKMDFTTDDDAESVSAGSSPRYKSRGRSLKT